ncbi:GntR family transcriptional regulator [Chimaeribacter californicus]|uniref:GntR family transcriptional regulator n=1 Tax=Chimaeribacter californicus TaxID=2060067 RepID=A0A2N5EGV4_9GAMM|nr:GntR family transcriptional regulator [Chimaeribacter californicus]PLR41760.1 GntR family transcriptional regulator [Chimaeribacter californicus]
MNRTATAKQREVTRIVDILAQAIAQHRLRPGTRLVEAHIVEALNANRNHVQAALQRLALQRIVTIAPNRGAMVSQPSAEEAREIFIARRAIERAIVEAITPEKMALHQPRLHAQMQSERAAIESGDRRAIVGALSSFHQVLAEVGGNMVLREILANLMVRSSLIVALYQRNDVPACSSGEHQAILDALAQGDAAAAVSLMLEHLNVLESQLDLSDSAAPGLTLRQALMDF